MPNSFEDRMIEAVERGETTPMEAYEYVRDVALDQADLQRKARKENPEPTKTRPETTEAEVLQTYTLQLLGPSPQRAGWQGSLQSTATGIGPRLLREAEENLSDLLPDGYSVRIKEQP